MAGKRRKLRTRRPAPGASAPVYAKRRRYRRRTRRGNGRSLFIALAFILLFALLYAFAGNLFTGSRGTLVPGEGEIIVSFLDVGQGDAILIRSAENAVLIDGGEHSRRRVVMDELRDAGVRRLCYVVATHPHSDHIGGLVTVLGSVEIGRLLMPDATNNTVVFENFLEAIENNNIDVTFPSPGDRIQAGPIDLTVVAPSPGEHANINNASIVLRMVHGQTSFLFTGDAERESEEFMLASGMTLRSNVLKVGHHGSHTSTTEPFLEAVSPSAAVISAGADNRFNHPHQVVLNRLAASGIPVYRTDELGTIRMITDGQRIFFANY